MRARPLTAAAAALAPLLLFGACRDSSGPEGALCAMGQRVTVNVATSGASGAPRITWSPACRVTFVQVEGAWTLYTQSGSIGSGVTYGTVPAGAKQTGPAPTLVAGTTYTVLVGGYIEGSPGTNELPGSGFSALVFGSAEFTP